MGGLNKWTGDKVREDIAGVFGVPKEYENGELDKLVLKESGG